MSHKCESTAGSVKLREEANASTGREKTVILFNARSIIKKWNLICLEINHYQPASIAITETWLSEDIAKYCSYHGFQQFYACRNGGGGGGVMLLIDITFSVVQIKPPVHPPLSCELLAVFESDSVFFGFLCTDPMTTYLLSSHSNSFLL